MVSALWNACSEGDLNAVVGLLEKASPADIETKGVFDRSKPFRNVIHTSLHKIPLVLHP
jgi:hypothetical protein